MRNLKKLLAVVLTVVMIASMMVPALAANTYEAEALKLQAIGLMAGEAADLKLEEGVTRIQGLAFAIRAAGKEADAFAMTDEEAETILADYVDGAAVPAWGKKYAAYAIKNAITVGVSATEKKFDALAPISGTSFLVFLMKAGMGYADVTTATVVEASVEAGILTAGQAAQFGAKAALIRDDAAGILYGAAMNGVNADGTPLIEALIASGFVDADAALAAGFVVEVEPEDLEVVSVEANNLKEVVVVFNKEVNEDTVVDANFDVSDFTRETAKLQADGVTVIVTLGDADEDEGLDAEIFDNDEEYTIEIEGVEDLDENVIKDTEIDFTVVDHAIPQVESIEFTGPQTAKLTFSEPINGEELEEAEVTVDNGIYYATIYSVDGAVVEIDLGTELDEGEHTFKIKGFQDFVPYKMITKSIDVTYNDVDDAPVFTVKEALQTKVTLSVDRPVKGMEIDTFYHTYSAWKPLSIVDKDGAAIVETDFYDEIVLKFTNDNDADTDRPLPEGNIKIVILAETDDYEIEDKWENNLDDDIELYVDIKADTTAPIIKKIKVEDEREVRFYFSEEVNKASAEKAANTSIKDPDGKVVKTYDYTRLLVQDGNDWYLRIMFDSAADEGEYEITFKDIKDVSLAENKMVSVTKTFEMTDDTGISFGDVDITGIDGEGIVYINYGTAMNTTGAYSVLDLDNYQFNEEDIDADDATISLFTSKIVKIKFKDDRVVVGEHLKIARVKDAKGNRTIEISSDNEEILLEEGPVITAVKKTADNKLELTVNKELKSVKAAGIKVIADGGDPTTIEDIADAVAVGSISFVNDGDETIIKVTVKADQKSTSGTRPLEDGYAIFTVEDNIKSVTGASMETVLYVCDEDDDTGFWKDGVAPKVKKVDIDGNDYDGDEMYVVSYNDGGTLITAITITYSEDINPTSVSKYTYKVGGYKVKGITVGDPDSGEVILTIENEDSDATDDSDATPTVTQVYEIEDFAGNTFKAKDSAECIPLGGLL